MGLGHVPLEGGTFEFGHAQRFTGTIVERPYPALQPEDAENSATPWLLLVAPGKHGADALVRGLDGRHVTLAGTRVRRGAHTMIEVDPESLVADTASASTVTAAAIQARSFGDQPVQAQG
jgi:hypothetical protein